MIYRKKYIDELHHLLGNSENKYIAIIGPDGIGKSTFLQECVTYDVFGKKELFQYVHITSENKGLKDIIVEKNVKIIVVNNEYNLPYSYIRTFIDSLSSEKRVVFSTQEEILDEDVTTMLLPGLSLREYLEHETGELSIAHILSGETNISSLNKYRDIYVDNGSSPYSLLSGGSTEESFESKRAFMYQELYEKEYEVFDTFLSTLAMSIGNLFKADQIAKLLDISRRKVHKYIEILEKHRIIESIDPWTQNSITETSRHAKYYFTELGYLKAILGDIHGKGTLKQGVIENMIYLELKRKLGETHTIYFYRKKSGAEITFIAEDDSTEMITPLIVTTRATNAIPQVFKVFDEENHDIIERYMLMNDSVAEISSLNEKQVMILPHIAI